RHRAGAHFADRDHYIAAAEGAAGRDGCAGVTRVIRIHETGGPDVMRWERADRKPLQPGEAWIRQTAIGVNFADIYYRRGVYPAPLPLILGREAAGVVEEVAADVTAVRPGDRVAYAGVNGSYAEGRAIAADRLVHVPDGIDDVTAAAATLRGMTAQVLIRGVCTVMSGDHVLVHAAAGGVGLLLCQWLSVLGAIVIGTVSSDEKAH